MLIQQRVTGSRKNKVNPLEADYYFFAYTSSYQPNSYKHDKHKIFFYVLQ